MINASNKTTSVQSHSVSSLRAVSNPTYTRDPREKMYTEWSHGYPQYTTKNTEHGDLSNTNPDQCGTKMPIYPRDSQGQHNPANAEKLTNRQPLSCLCTSNLSTAPQAQHPSYQPSYQSISSTLACASQVYHRTPPRKTSTQPPQPPGKPQNVTQPSNQTPAYYYQEHYQVSNNEEPTKQEPRFENKEQKVIHYSSNMAIPVIMTPDRVSHNHSSADNESQYIKKQKVDRFSHYGHDPRNIRNTEQNYKKQIEAQPIPKKYLPSNSSMDVKPYIYNQESKISCKSRKDYDQRNCQESKPRYRIPPKEYSQTYPAYDYSPNAYYRPMYPSYQPPVNYRYSHYVDPRAYYDSLQYATSVVAPDDRQSNWMPYAPRSYNENSYSYPTPYDNYYNINPISSWCSLNQASMKIPVSAYLPYHAAPLITPPVTSVISKRHTGQYTSSKNSKTCCLCDQTKVRQNLVNSHSSPIIIHDSSNKKNQFKPSQNKSRSRIISDFPKPSKYIGSNNYTEDSGEQTSLAIESKEDNTSMKTNDFEDDEDAYQTPTEKKNTSTNSYLPVYIDSGTSSIMFSQTKRVQSLISGNTKFTANSTKAMDYVESESSNIMSSSFTNSSSDNDEDYLDSSKSDQVICMESKKGLMFRVRARGT